MATAVVTAIIVLSPMLLGEGPVWVERDQALMFVDITGEYLYRYFEDTERVQRLKLYDTSPISSSSIIIPVKDSLDEYIVTVGKKVAHVQWSVNDTDHISREPTTLDDVEGSPYLRFNDGKCDPRGRLWSGTMEQTAPLNFTLNAGYLYRMDNNNTMTPVIPNITIPNGMAWNAARTKFFYVDSTTEQIAVFDYDDITGEISNRKVLFDFAKNGLEGQIPDGMAIDTDDNIWVACFYGYQVINVDTKTGKLIRSIPIPSRGTTSCAFGGKDYSTLYVTSAGLRIDQKEAEKYPLTGGTFKVTGLGVKGLPPNECVINKALLQ